MVIQCFLDFNPASTLVGVFHNTMVSPCYTITVPWYLYIACFCFMDMFIDILHGINMVLFDWGTI